MVPNQDMGHTTKPVLHARSAGLQIFLSYASERERVAEEIALALKERGHRVFFDRDRLAPGKGFHARIEQEVRRSDLFVFLISPELVKTGSYALTELHYASQRFEHPDGQVLPVLVAPTPLDGIPTYLRAVTLLEPKGNPAAEVAAEVDRLCTETRRRVLPGTQRDRTGPWAIATIGVVALLAVVLVTGWPDDYSQQAKLPDDDHRKRVDFSDQRRSRELDRAEIDFKQIDIRPRLAVFGPGSVKFTWLTQSNMPHGVNVFYSTNGIEYQNADKNTLVKIENNPVIKFQIRASNDDLIKELDKTEVLLEALRENFEREWNSVKSDTLWGCDAFRCAFRKSSDVFCTPLTKSVRLGITRDHFTDDLDLSGCGSYPVGICVTPAELSFPLWPGRPIFAEIALGDGNSRVLEIPVEFATHLYGRSLLMHTTAAEWFLLAPIAEQNGGRRAPLAAARYTPPRTGAGKFSIAFVHGGCAIPRTEDQNHILLDLDGRGLVDFGDFKGAIDIYYSPDNLDKVRLNTNVAFGPKTRALGIAVGPEHGPYDGPFWYNFDPFEVVRETAAKGALPAVACSGLRKLSHSTETQICAAEDRLGWLHAGSVRVGPNAGDWTQEIEVDFTAEDYLNTTCDLRRHTCPPFIFEIPGKWTDVFTQVTLKDGRTLAQQRHVLDR